MSISRRRVMQGAAWTAPVAAVCGVAPAFAASPGCTPSVESHGRVSCSYDGTSYTTFTIDGRVDQTRVGAKDYGVVVLCPDAVTSLDALTMTLWLPDLGDDFTFTSQLSTWTDLVRDPATANATRTGADGVEYVYEAYTTTYSGAWDPTGQFDFLFSLQGPSAAQTAMVDGQNSFFQNETTAIVNGVIYTWSSGSDGLLWRQINKV